jgi:hypothetical protein
MLFLSPLLPSLRKILEVHSLLPANLASHLVFARISISSPLLQLLPSLAVREVCAGFD